jgi:(p)ppGpp synthase/HD superfamily hydrolase
MPAKLSQRFEEAVIMTLHLHADQKRKGSGIPYAAHLFAVTSLVIEDDGDEDLAIAAMLHDAVEDQGGLETLTRIRQIFGDRVADIVEGCSDACSIPKPPWRQRKERYLDHLVTANSDVLRVSLADKLHNARSILRDLRTHGDKTWKRFTGGKEGSLWYYRKLVDVFSNSDLSSPMVDEFALTVEEIELFSKLCT